MIMPPWSGHLPCGELDQGIKFRDILALTREKTVKITRVINIFIYRYLLHQTLKDFYEI